MSHNALDEVVAALQLLAADVDEQIGSFPSYVCVADEIALMVNRAALLCSDSEGMTVVPQWLWSAIVEIDAALDAVSGSQNSALWTNEALAKAIQWHHLRESSKHLLKRLGVERVGPQVSDTFVPIDGSS